MGEDSGTGRPSVTGAREPDEIRGEIEATRRELGDTIEALSEKTDVRSQARHRVGEAKATIVEKKDELLVKARELSPDTAVSAASQASETARQNPMPFALMGAFALGFLLGRLTSG